MRINHNIAALNTYRQLTGNVGSTSKSLEKLSSGLRINKAGDDAAGLAISEKMRAQIRGLDQASRNASDAISLIQTAEGALTETHSILQRMRELAVQSATDTNTGDDRAEIQKEINNLLDEVDRIAGETQFNGQKLLDGSYKDRVFHIGANKGQKMEASIGAMGQVALDIKDLSPDATYASFAGGGDAPSATGDPGISVASGDFTIDKNSELKGKYEISITVADSKATLTLKKDGVSDPLATIALDNTSATGDEFKEFGISFKPSTVADGGKVIFTVEQKVDPTKEGLTTKDGANAAIDKIDKAIQKVSSERAKLGGVQNRLEHTINNLGATSENLAASESRIRDVDMAKEMMEFTKNNILSQASQAMLAQANMQPQSVLQLLQ
ncbi:MAG: flagellin [Anaerovoracaceae bacterium]